MDDFELGGKLPPQRQLPSPSPRPVPRSVPRPALSLGPVLSLPPPSGSVSVSSQLPPAVSDSSTSALDELVDSISELVEISAETRDITLESYKEATTEVAGESKESKGNTSITEGRESVHDSSSWRDTYNQIADKVNEGLTTLGGGIIEAGKIAHNPFVLVDKLFEEGLPKLKSLQDKESNDTFDPNRILREMAGVRQRDEGLAERWESNDLADSVVVGSPLSGSLDNLADVVADSVVVGSPLSGSLDNLAERWESNDLADSVVVGSPLTDSRDLADSVVVGSPLTDSAGVRKDGLLGSTVESTRPFTSQAVDPMSGSPDSVGGGGGVLSVLRQMSTHLRTLTMAGTKARPIYTYLLDLDNVAGEEGLYESLAGDGGEGGFLGSSVVDIDVVGGAGGRGANNSLNLGDAKWIAISAAIIALAEPIDKLVTAMTNPETGFGKMVGAIGGFAESLLANDGPMLRLINTLTDVVEDILRPLGSTISNLIKVIEPPLVKITEMLGEAVVTALTETLEMFSLLKNNPSQFFTNIADGMKVLFSAIFNDFVGELVAGIANSIALTPGYGDKAEYLRRYGFSERNIRDVLKHNKDVEVDNPVLLEALGLGGAVAGMVEVSFEDNKPLFHAVSLADYESQGDIISRDSKVSTMAGVRDVTDLMRDRVFGKSTLSLPSSPIAAVSSYSAVEYSPGGSSGFSTGTNSSALHIKEINVVTKSEPVAEYPNKD